MNRDAFRKRFHTLLRLAGEYRAEFVAAIVALVGIFFLFEQFELKQIIWDFLAQAGFSIQEWLIRVGGTFGLLLASLTVSNILGLILIGAAIFIVGQRFRWRLLKAYKMGHEACPRCGHVLARSHRTLSERVLSRVLFIHIRGYRCTNSECRWRGIRASG